MKKILALVIMIMVSTIGTALAATIAVLPTVDEPWSGSELLNQVSTQKYLAKFIYDQVILNTNNTIIPIETATNAAEQAKTEGYSIAKNKYDFLQRVTTLLGVDYLVFATDTYCFDSKYNSLTLGFTISIYSSADNYCGPLHGGDIYSPTGLKTKVLGSYGQYFNLALDDLKAKVIETKKNSNDYFSKIF